MKEDPFKSRLERLAGFTMVEALVVVVIIAILLTILLPTLQNARHSTKVATCASNLKQYGAGMNRAIRHDILEFSARVLAT